jgi:hypothetical protein
MCSGEAPDATAKQGFKVAHMAFNSELVMVKLTFKVCTQPWECKLASGISLQQATH